MADVAQQPAHDRTRSDCQHEKKGSDMKTRTAVIISTAWFALSACAMSPEHAMEDRAEADYDARVSSAERTYDRAMERCDALSGNAEEVCEKEAKAERESALIDAKAKYKEDEVRADKENSRLDAEYEAARERCDALSGSAEDACISEAELKYHR